MPDVAELSVLLSLRDQASAGLKSFQGKLDSMGRQAAVAGRGLTVLAAPIAAIGALSVKAAIDFESSFAGVRKTVDATEAEFAQLAAGMRDLATTIPVNVNGLNSIGEAAGQLGIKTENILEFTRVVAAMGVTTNLTTDSAATAFARIANITGLPQTRFENLGSTVVALGNNLATTEEELVNFALRIAGAGTIAGLTQSDILAIGGAMSSVGVQAEAGGTAVQKVLLAMTQSVSTGSDELAVFAEVAGLTAAEFSTAFKDDAAGAFASFVEGLGLAGNQAFGILEELGLVDQRLIRSFLSLANAGDLLRESIDLGSGAWETNTALAKEAEQRYGTTASQMAVLKNQVQDLFITIGDNLVPVIMDAIDAVKPLIATFKQFAQDNPALAKGIILASVALLGLGAALVGIGFILPAVAAGLGLVGGILGFIFSPAILVVAAIAAIGVAWLLLLTNFDAVTKFIGQIFRSGWGWILPGGVMIKAFLFIKDNWEALWNGAQRVFKHAAVGISETVTGIANVFISGVNALIRAWNRLPFVKDLGTIDKIKFSLTTTFNDVKDAAIDMAGNGFDAATSAFGGLKEAVGDSFSTLGSKVKEVLENLGVNFGAFGDQTHSVVEDIQDDFAQLIATAGDFKNGMDEATQGNEVFEESLISANATLQQFLATFGKDATERAIAGSPTPFGTPTIAPSDCRPSAIMGHVRGVENPRV